MKRINPYKLFVGSFIPNWLLQRSEISDSAKVIYARLSQYAGEYGCAFPLLETIAKETGKSEATVRRAIAELKKAKLIETEQRGLGQSNLYFFLAHSWMKNSPGVLKSERSECSNLSVLECSNLHAIRESVEENHIREKSRPSAASSTELDPKIKEWVDKVYSIDKVKFRRLVVWIRAAERTYEPEVIAATLQAFEPLAREVSNDWWPYLDRILDKVEGKINASRSEADHEARKEAEAEFTRATFGGRELRKDTRKDR